MASRICWLALAALAAIFGVFLALPSSIDPVAYSFSDDDLPEFVGPLAINDRLSTARLLFKDEIGGPESFAMADGYIYTGLDDGRIIRFSGTNPTSYETVVSCTQGDCGRPLGLYFHPHDKGTLFVADCNKGLLSVDLNTRKMETLVPIHRPLSGITLPLMFIDDLVVLSNRSIYFTDLSNKFGYQDAEAEVMEARPIGRLLHYNPSDGSLQTVLEGLHAPNGVCIGPSEEFLLINEVTRARVTRYYLKGPKVGTVDFFAQNLPGLPDNITPSSKGGYWIGFAAARYRGALDIMAGLPWLRAQIFKSGLIGPVKALVQKHGMIVELDANGRIVRSLHDPHGVVATSATTVLDLGDTLLVGSYYAPYIVVITL